MADDKDSQANNETEVTRLRQDLEASRNLYRHLTESMPQLVWSANANGQITSVNQQWLDYTGKSEADSLGRGWLEVVHPDDVARSRKIWQHNLDNQLPYVGELRLRRSDDVYRWHVSRAMPIKNEAGHLISWLGTLTDIDDQRRAEEIFISVTTHELRTPLTSIKGYSQLLQRNALKRLEALDGQAVHDLFERDEAYLSAILRQVDVMIGLINQMLDTARLQTGQLSLDRRPATNLTALIGEVAQEWRNSNLNRAIKLNIGSKPVLCNCDPTRIRQVLGSLISNALKYSQAEQAIEVCLEQQPSNEIKVWVKDQGVGIKLHDQPHVFDRFFNRNPTHNQPVDGLGLGLYLSREIIFAHGGQMWLQSTAGQGSTFYFTLPGE